MMLILKNQKTFYAVLVVTPQVHLNKHTYIDNIKKDYDHHNDG